tara:strand:- start:1004 stop:2731 length:1728 start_codon:yes stop_codon:yes gene_type:complete
MKFFRHISKNLFKKKALIIFAVLFSINSFSQNNKIKLREIPSITDWIEEINNWQDSTYTVKNIKVLIDANKDSLFIQKAFKRNDTINENIAAIINKPVIIDGLEFDNSFGLPGAVYAIKNIRFKERVRLSNFQGLGFQFTNMVFEKNFSIRGSNRYVYYNFSNCIFNAGIGFFDFYEGATFSFVNCNIDKSLQITRTPSKPELYIFNSNVNTLVFASGDAKELVVKNSSINVVVLQGAIIESVAHFVNNKIDEIDISGAKLPDNNTYISFDQISKKLFVNIYSIDYPNGKKYEVSDTMDFEMKEHYDLLIASYTLLLNSYQNIGEQDSYNACYIEMKNIQTRRLEYLYTKSPTFKGFFTWKINQFLKIFSGYGTEPARAVIFSMYVIFLFAFIYLLFPNSWDSHGRKRIMDRYAFFFTYMNKKSGIHEVYLENQKPELLEFEDFKTLVDKQGKSVPKFFTATALPLYKWAISGTKLSASILKRVDIMKGTWSDLPKSKRIWKSILLIGAFTIAVIYDIFIKMLNALMLSINTFTTLGFGEIPIKGLPRYLAIIQGFIGWFMLTIFSVSLISQLLN